MRIICLFTTKIVLKNKDDAHAPENLCLFCKTRSLVHAPKWCYRMQKLGRRNFFAEKNQQCQGKIWVNYLLATDEGHGSPFRSWPSEPSTHLLVLFRYCECLCWPRRQAGGPCRSPLSLNPNNPVHLMHSSGSEILPLLSHLFSLSDSLSGS